MHDSITSVDGALSRAAEKENEIGHNPNIEDPKIRRLANLYFRKAMQNDGNSYFEDDVI